MILQRGFPGSCDTLKEALEYCLRFSVQLLHDGHNDNNDPVLQILPNACKEDPEKFREDIGEQQVCNVRSFRCTLTPVTHLSTAYRSVESFRSMRLVCKLSTTTTVERKYEQSACEFCQQS